MFDNNKYLQQIKAKNNPEKSTEYPLPKHTKIFKI